MYNSWWFLGLLGLLCTNLIVCSLERFPGVWKMIRNDGLAVPLKRLEKMGRKTTWKSSLSMARSVSEMSNKLSSIGWKSRRCQRDGGIMLFAQKGAYSRTGVYLVHVSILVILAGATLGELTGFKGSVMLPETRQTDKVYAFNSSESIDLGFSIRCDSFSIKHYDTGMVKEYSSLLTVMEPGKESFQTAIEVNKPLTHRGVTFYQSGYEAYNDFLVQMTNIETGNRKTIIIPFQTEVQWAEEGLSFGIVNVELVDQSVQRIKVWFSGSKGGASVFWLGNGESTRVEREGQTYLLSAKQLHATGLQVAKDPGVWLVYLGCGLMLFGLMVAFFLSHRRIWLFISEEDGGASVLFVGNANKNRVGFENSFGRLAEWLQKG
ncbi:MAG: cytochrome c biogenesis protein ResB [Desulfocapsa sp.]|nr:cytochrome c biogenesis protein ResB [Desulfocapsa sp.]